MNEKDYLAEKEAQNGGDNAEILEIKQTSPMQAIAAFAEAMEDAYDVDGLDVIKGAAELIQELLGVS